MPMVMAKVIELYYYPSYVSLFPHILLHELGLDHRLVFVDRFAEAHKREAYLALNPNGLIPVLIDRSLVLYEAAAIALHLIDAHPRAGLAPPAGTQERAQFYKWLMWLATGLHPALSMYLHPGKWTADEKAQGSLRTDGLYQARDAGKLARRRVLGRAAYLKSQGRPH